MATSSSPTRSKVFISYSHVDHRHLARLQKHLAYFEHKKQLEVWDDTRIAVGTKWRQEIEKALQEARVAVLLVSADFLASKFILENELPPLLAAAESGGATVVVVVVNSCAFEDTDLGHYQAANTPSRPVQALANAKRERVWADVARLVIRALPPASP